MKHLFLIAALTAATAAHAGPCELLAREQTQGNFDAYASLAKKYPGDVWDRYRACEGQKVKLEATRIKPLSPDAYLYLYDYSIDCGASTLRATTGYIYKFGRCEISGE